MIVMKFGGTSVQDCEAIENAAGIVLAQRERTPLVVVSACAGVTNQLISIAEEARKRNTQAALKTTDQLLARHILISSRLLSGDSRAAVDQAITGNIEAVRQLISGVSALQELTARTLDQFQCIGELCSSLLLYHALLKRAAPAAFIDARKVVVTDDEFGKGQPLFKWTKRGARVHILPALKHGQIAVTQGFIGSTREGVPITLGRGGSDYSAAVLGSVLDAEEIQIWTDVEGILTADPSLLTDAKPIPEMTFSEASELAYFGAKVLHPSTLLPAVRKNIPVRVLNSRQPDRAGTIIKTETRHGGNGEVKSIAYKEGITAIRIESSSMLMANGFLGDLLQVFARHKKGIDLVATSLVGVSVTIRETTGLEALVADLEQLGKVTVEKNKAICCVVGEGLKSARGIAARVFAALDRASVPVEMISHGGSDINLTVLIDEGKIRPAVEALHREFFASQFGGQASLPASNRTTEEPRQSSSTRARRPAPQNIQTQPPPQNSETGPRHKTVKRKD